MGEGIAGFLIALALLAQGYENISIISSKDRTISSLAALGLAPVGQSQDSLPEAVSQADVFETAKNHLPLFEENETVEPTLSYERDAPQHLIDMPEARQEGVFTISDSYKINVAAHLQLIKTILQNSSKVTFISGNCSVENNRFWVDGVEISTADHTIFVDASGGGLKHTAAEQVQSSFYRSGLTLIVPTKSSVKLPGVFGDNRPGGHYVGLSDRRIRINHGVPNLNSGSLCYVFSSAANSPDPYSLHNLLPEIKDLVDDALPYIPKSAEPLRTALEKISPITDHQLLNGKPQLFDLKNQRSNSRNPKIIILAGQRKLRSDTPTIQELDNGLLFTCPSCEGDAYTRMPFLASWLAKKVRGFIEDHPTFSHQSLKNQTHPTLEDLFLGGQHDIGDLTDKCIIKRSSATDFLLALFLKAHGHDPSIHYSPGAENVGYHKLNVVIDTQFLSQHAEKIFSDAEKVTSESIRLLHLFATYSTSGVAHTENPDTGSTFTVNVHRYKQFLLQTAIRNGVEVQFNQDRQPIIYDTLTSSYLANRHLNAERILNFSMETLTDRPPEIVITAMGFDLVFTKRWQKNKEIIACDEPGFPNILWLPGAVTAFTTELPGLKLKRASPRELPPNTHPSKVTSTTLPSPGLSSTP